MALEEKVPALEQVDFRFRRGRDDKLRHPQQPVRVPCYESARCIALHRRVPESLDLLDLVQVSPITLGFHIVAMDKPQRG